MAHSSPEGIELGKGSQLVSLDLSINNEKVLEIKPEDIWNKEKEKAVVDFILKQRQEELENYARQFTNWKDSNFLMSKDGMYYAKTSSKHFDITKYIGKEKPTKHYSLDELLELFKK